jgi:hypothetical protein
MEGWHSEARGGGCARRRTGAVDGTVGRFLYTFLDFLVGLIYGSHFISDIALISATSSLTAVPTCQKPC